MYESERFRNNMHRHQIFHYLSKRFFFVKRQIFFGRPEPEKVWEITKINNENDY